MPPLRAPWPLHLATAVTWAVVGVAGGVGLVGRPEQLADPVWTLRIFLYASWAVAVAGATLGEITWGDPRRIAFLVLLGASALTLLASAPTSPALSLVFPASGIAPFLLKPRQAVSFVALLTMGVAGVFGSAMAPIPAAISTLCTLGGLIFGLGAGHLAVSERRARVELARVNAELQATLALLADTVREGERTRISRELHDSLGHHLTAMSVTLEVASHLAKGKVAQHVAQAHELAKRLLADVRDTVSAMHGERPVDLGAALTLMIAGIPSPRVHLALPGELRISSTALAHTVFRCVQEIVTNTLRHAEARNLWIELRREPGGLVVEARDDGRGAPAYSPGHGLRGMGERVEEIGGSLVVASHPGRGFEVRAILPLAEDSV
jgi:signal transduction histidine kinase